ncbi:MAG: hypothetical protein ACRD2R_09140, partial [Terriglobales bacterium]
MKAGFHRGIRALPGRRCFSLLLLILPAAVGAQDGPQGGEARLEAAASERSASATAAAPTWPAARMILEMKTGETHLENFAPSREGSLARWFELETASLSTRYHWIQNSSGETAANNQQYQVTLQGRLKLDHGGRYSVHAGVFSGNSFFGGWNQSGWGTGKGQSNLFLKQLYFSARPARGVEVQYGGLSFLHGESTETTSYDYDGYLVGERISLTRPLRFYFDEIAITYGYLGDFNRPSVSQRFHRLRQSNYHQFLLRKKIGERIHASVQYAYEAGVETMREAARVRLPEARVVDIFLFENYQRLGADPGYG